MPYRGSGAKSDEVQVHQRAEDQRKHRSFMRIVWHLPFWFLCLAITLRQPEPGLIHHSDRGSQYCLTQYQMLLKRHGMIASMSGKGNCYDNAPVEAFFKTIKAELIWRMKFETHYDAERKIFGYINDFYDPRRRHSALGNISPAAYDKLAA